MLHGDASSFIDRKSTWVVRTETIPLLSYQRKCIAITKRVKDN
jgi:hypothetical protein